MAEPEARRTEVEEWLAASVLFRRLAEEDRARLAQLAELRSYRRGRTVFREGDPSRHFFTVVSGRVKVFTLGGRGEHLPLAELGPGDFFGEVSLLTGKPRTATITAGTKVSAIELDRAAVDEIAQEHPEVLTTLDDFCRQRAHQAVEAVIRRLRRKGGPTTARETEP